MLYVFHVDAGVMVTFDMSLTLQTVMGLKMSIEKKLKIPADMIVLLVSGGEVLQSENLVSSYAAGTDSSPIFMFTKPSMRDFKQANQYSVNILSPIVELSDTYSEWSSNAGPVGEIKSLAELKSAVEMCRSLPPAVSTVATCAKVAQQFSDCAQSLSRSCEQLVHDQHLQHQGWAAVVANLEDIFIEFTERSINFKDTFKKHKLKKEYYQEQMQILNSVLESLGKIPILPSLQLNAEAHRFSAFDVFDEASVDRQFVQSSGHQSSSSDNKAYQDFGVEAFKLSEEEVFEDSKGKISSPCLAAAGAESLAEVEGSAEAEGSPYRTRPVDGKEPTLLHWILAQGNQDALQDILDYCQKGIILIDAEPLKEREAELRNILEYANVQGLKQIKGIEDRLYGLDQLKKDICKLEKDQHDQAASLIQNRERVSATCDASVLPTLVQSHRCQLEKLLKNHQLLVDIKRRIAKSKEELSHIMKARLEAVFTIENSMSVQDAHQMLSFQCFNRLARYFEVVEQLHRAPAVFLRAVHEVARRRTFSTVYMQWAVTIARHLLIVHTDEVARRQEFNALFEGHFLRTLFPGVADMPPAFATEEPAVFDARLPKITYSDAEYVSSIFPELAKDIPKYDMGPIVNYFRQLMAIMEREDKTIDAESEVDKVVQSEFEAYEFEKLSRQSPTVAQKTDISTSCMVPETVTVSTVTEVRPPLPHTTRKSEEFESSDFYIEESLPASLEWGRETQDNMDIHKINMERLKDFLIRLYDLCKLNVLHIREELQNFQKQINDQKQYIANQCIEICKACEQNNEQVAISFREETQRLTVDHELELSDMKKLISYKDEVINTITNDLKMTRLDHQSEREQLLNDHEITRELLEKALEEVNEYKRKLEEADIAKQREIKELQDRMHMDYKAELELVRSRFRMVVTSNMDRSPSESSLEKIERTDVIEISSHNAIVMQTKENAEVEKEEAVREAVERCEKEWRQKRDLVTKCEEEKQRTQRDVSRRLIAEKDRQIETLREREAHLVRECTKYKETIQQLADPETNDYDSLLKTQLASLENEKTMLAQQVKDLKKELELRAEQDKKETDSETTPSSSSSRTERTETLRRGRRSHTPLGLEAGTLSLSACLPGNCVLVMWDPAHDNYTVMQESSIMYFVHSDCLQSLGLSINVTNESDRRLYAIGIVEFKEFCYAKKSANRYHMPRASKFYRVRVRPSRDHQTVPCCCAQRHPRGQDCLKPMQLSVFTDRPVKKWLTYLHAPDMQRSVETSQYMSSSVAVAEAGEVGAAREGTAGDGEAAREAGSEVDAAREVEGAETEVATGTLINLESPERPPAIDEDQLDSIEASADWLPARMQHSIVSTNTDMECSVGRVAPCPQPEAAP